MHRLPHHTVVIFFCFCFFNQWHRSMLSKRNTQKKVSTSAVAGVTTSLETSVQLYVLQNNNMHTVTLF